MSQKSILKYFTHFGILPVKILIVISVLIIPNCLTQTKTNILQLFPCPHSQLNSTQILLHVSPKEANTSSDLIFGVKSTEFEGCPGANFLHTFDHESSLLLQKTLTGLNSTGLLQLGKEYYHPSEFCVTEWNDKRIEVQICNATCEGKTPCISKCCSIGKSLSYEDGEGCKQNDGEYQEWTPKLFRDPWTQVSTSERSTIQPHISHKPPTCSFPNGTIHHFHHVWPSIDIPDYDRPKIPFRLGRDGNILRLSPDRTWVLVSRNTFCIDDLIVSNVTMMDPNFSGHPLVLIECENQQEETGRRLSIVYIVAMFISAFFLLLTAIVYIILWERLCTSVHGWTILSYVTSMFFLYIFLAISHSSGLIWYNTILSGTTFCMIIGATIHFFFISTFSFLTLINLDLWLTFRSHTPIGERSKGLRRFGLYNLFAWGSATFVVTIGFILDHEFPDIESSVIVPQYGQVNCFMSSAAVGYYVYSIIGVLLAINLIFIALTVWTINQFRKTSITSMIPHRPQQSFKLFLKIFIVCGLTWVLEIISWLSSREKTKLYWLFLDCVNILQAIGIFTIFICKKKTIKQLQQKFETSKCCNIRSRRHRSTECEPSTGVTGTSTKQSRCSSTTQSIHLRMTGRT